MRIPERPSNQDQVKDALLLARQIASDEIESIDRLHKRTLASLAVIAGIVTAFWAIVAFIGFDNLKGAAIAVAESQMRDEVTRQVQEKLTKENINQIVREQIQSYTSQNLTNQIHKVLTEPPVSLSIKEAADREAQEMIHKQFSPRRFTSEQSRLLIEQVNGTKALDGLPIAVNSLTVNVEANNYAAQIKESLSHCKMKLVEFYGFPEARQVEGVGIYYDAQRDDTKAHLLGDALSRAGVPFTFMPVSGQPATSPPNPLEIYVGAKPMR